MLSRSAGAWFPWPAGEEERVLFPAGLPGLSKAALLEQSERLARQLQEAGIRRGHVVATLLPGGLEMVVALLGVPLVATLAPLNPSLTSPEIRASLEELGAAAVLTPQGIQRLDPVAEDHSLQDVALILFTSATTGRPKQVPLSFSNLEAMAMQILQALRLGPQDRLLGFMPLFHLQGIINLLVQIRAGGGAAVQPRFQPDDFPRWLAEYEPTWYTAGPTIHGAILELAPFPVPASLHFARSIGARLMPDKAKALEDRLGVPVLEGYGLTECGTVAQNPPPPGVRKPGSVGLPCGARIRILPTGEILFSGASVVRGYRKSEAATRAAFRDGWLHTGDLGCFDADGYLYVTGRLKEMINRGGEKVAPAEVDEALAAHPGVAEAAAFALPHPTLGEEVAAAVVPRGGAGPGPAELRAFASQRLAPHKLPRRIFFVDALPRGATGKIRRPELAARFAHAEMATVPPSTPFEAELAELWRRRLPGCPVCVQTDWYALGGDSLGLVRFMTEIEIRYGLPAGTLEENGFAAEPTIQNLARRLEAPQLAAPVISFHPEGSKTPFFCLPGVHGAPFYLASLAENLAPDRPVFLLRLPAAEMGRGCPVEEIAAMLLEQVRALRPAGPYLFGGHCYGGLVAWEMAAQAAAAGEVRGHVVLFDAAVPGGPRPWRSWRAYGRALGSWAAALRQGRVGEPVNAALEHWRYLKDLRRRREQDLQLLHHPESAPSAAAVAAAAARNWRPRPLPWDVAVFLAARPRRAEVLRDPCLMWQDFTRGSFSSFPAEGAHADMFAGQPGERLARQIRAWLDEREPAPG